MIVIAGFIYIKQQQNIELLNAGLSFCSPSYRHLHTGW